MGKSKTSKQDISTEGGAFVGGNVSMGNNSKFVGRDDNSQSDFTNKLHQRRSTKKRLNVPITKSLIVGVMSIAVFELLIYFIPWTWLITHPNSYGLQLAIDVLLMLLGFMLFIAEWRKYLIRSMLIPIFGFLLALLKTSK